MTKTSKALKRLGVVGVAVLTIGAGMPTLLATSASAAHVTTVTLSPDTQQVQPTAGNCAPFTINIQPAASRTVDVQIEQITTNSTAGANDNIPAIGFCSPGANAGPNPQTPTGAPNTAGGTTTTDPTGTVITNSGTNVCPAATTTTSGTTRTNTARCNAEFNTDASGNVTFGVFSDRVGQVRVTAYAEEARANPVAGNQTGNNVPNTGEPADESTLFVVLNNQASVTTVDCEPETQRGNVNGSVSYTCTVSGANGTITNAQLQYVITSGPDATQTPRSCNLPNGNPATTNQNGQLTCTITNGGTAGSNQVFIFAEANSQAGPQAAEAGDEVTAVFAGLARTIDCEPETANAAAGSEQVVECRVTDVNGAVVSGQNVRFDLTGVGRITNNECFSATSGNDRCDLQTNNAGLVRLFVRADANGTATVNAQLLNANGTLASSSASSECRQAAGSTTQPGVNASGRAAGVCNDEVTRTFGAAATQSPTAAPTGTATPGPTGTAQPTGGATTPPATSNPTAPTTKLGLTVTGPGTITPGQQAILRGTGQANALVTLRCYSRPSTEYFDARNASLGEDGSVEFRLNPGTNTRCFLKYAGAADNDARNSASVVQNVATALSLSVRRLGVRNYVFEGRILPRRSGQLITLYRVDSTGREVLTAQVRTDATGTWRINRVFTGSGTFNFIARTGQNLTNVAGRSNVRPTAIF